MSIIRHLNRLQKIKRKKHHSLIHKIHRKHRISKKTLFYVKEYGPHSNVPRTIIRESLKILLFASILSSLGGLALNHIKTVFISILPLVIMLPTLNDMVGDYGTIIASRFSTMLHEEKIKKKLFTLELKELLNHILFIALITTILTTIIALVISYFSTSVFDLLVALKVLAITLINSIIMIATLFLICVWAGLHYYRKLEDPNNFLIPLLTAIADFTNMIILAFLVVLFF